MNRKTSLLLRGRLGDHAKKISPIEAKSTKRYTTASLDKFKKKFGGRIGREYVVHTGQLRVDGNRTYLPLYMGWLL